jgi:cephalosporin-C deacetylase
MPFFDLKDPDLATYRSRVTPPDDFDAFWAQTLAETREHELDAVFTAVDVGLPVFDVFDVTFSGFGGHRIKAWFIRPRGTRAERCVVKFIGYGGGRDKPHTHLLWPGTGRSVLVMDTRGQGSTWGTSDTPDPAGSDPAHPGYMTRGILDPKTYYYRRVFIDGVRAVEAARSRAEIDPDRIAITGGSQGGGIAIAVAGLDPNVWVTMPDVPYLCDFPRSVGLAVRDPYNEIVRYLSVHRDKVDTVFSTLRYFDGVNLGRRARARALFSVGLMDDICPPSTVLGAFREYAGDKELVEYRFNNHEGGGSLHETRQVEWLAAQG